jgi:hypothetical protein
MKIELSDIFIKKSFSSVKSLIQVTAVFGTGKVCAKRTGWRFSKFSETCASRGEVITASKRRSSA